MKYVAKMSLVTILASILSLAALFLVQIHFASIYHEQDRVYGSLFRQTDLARVIQVDFKKQVQEWKDILLRGHDPQDLVTYSRAFFQQESKIRRECADLGALIQDPAAQKILEEFSASHQKMGLTYREALGLFTNTQDPRQADARVRGQDRIPTDQIDAIVALLSAESRKKQDLSSAQLAAQQGRIRWISVAFFVGLLSVTLFLTLRFTSPIASFSQTVRYITLNKNYSVRAEQKSDDEVGKLVGGFNGMLDEVQAGRALFQKSRDELEHRMIELADKEEQLRALSNSISDGIVSADEAGKIVSWNQGAETIFGYSSKEAIGQPLSVVAQNGSNETLTMALTQHDPPVEASGATRKKEIVGRRKDGSCVPLEASLATWKKGPHTYYGSILRDISERKKIDQMKSEFISTVSHELRTPLTSIRGSLGLLSSGVVGALPPKAKPMIEIATKNCERLVRLVSDILDVEKISSGQLFFKFGVLSVAPFVAQVIAANRGFASALGVTLAQESGQGEIQVRADSDRLAQVLTNLISNACKCSPRGETVTVGIQRRGPRVRVVVEDHGPGIPEEFRPRIFQKFAQADTSDGSQRKGTGLGLAISKGLIERMGGTIGFDTNIGAGTTFYFDLEVETAPVGSLAPSPGARPRILICEDERDIAEVLRGILDREGFETDVAPTLKEAKELLGRGSYAGMTLDLSLPDGNGLHLLKELRKNPSTAQLPVIVISAHLDQNGHDLSGNAFGLVNWLEKPIPEDRLREALRSCCPPHLGKRPRILHIEDDPDVCRIVAELLGDAAEVVQSGTVRSAWDRLREEDFDLMIIDVGLPDGSGLELLPALRRSTQTPIPSLVFSAHEISPRTERYVSAALLKSKTSNEELVGRVRHLLGMAAPAAAGLPLPGVAAEAPGEPRPPGALPKPVDPGPSGPLAAPPLASLRS